MDPVAASSFLTPDSYPYASQPGGIKANTTSFYSLFARQLGRLLLDLNGGKPISTSAQSSGPRFDTVMLRDGFSAQVSYRR